MAFNNVSLFSLAAGNSVWVWVTRGGVFQTDYGAQWIMAHPEMNTGWYPEFGTAKSQVDHFQKEVFFSANTGGQYVTYRCLVSNVGSMSTKFSLQGGGNV